jgi:uncharacterized protein YcbK (DUF882 family)
MSFRRRDLIRGSLALGGVMALAGPGQALASALYGQQARKLSVVNLHTGETLSTAYWENGEYVPQALEAVNHVLRDHRTNEVHTIEPTLLDLMTVLSRQVDTNRPFEIISGYRSPATNAALHDHTTGVASNSLHMQGQAVDLRVEGVKLAHLRDVALEMQLGGVGFYPASDFVHVDVGRIRRW